jgi:hypothetical protein
LLRATAQRLVMAQSRPKPALTSPDERVMVAGIELVTEPPPTADTKATRLIESENNNSPMMRNRIDRPQRGSLRPGA